MTYMNVLLSVGFSIRPARASSILHSDWRTIRHLLSFLEVLFFLGRFFSLSGNNEQFDRNNSNDYYR